MTIQDLGSRKDLSLVTDSQDVELLLQYLHITQSCYGGLFIREIDGDIVEAYGFDGCVPFIHKQVYSLL